MNVKKPISAPAHASGKPQRPLKVYKRPPKATIIAALLLLIFFVMLVFAVPARLPSIIQRLVGLTNALLALATVKFGVTELAPKKYKTFKIFGRTQLDTGTTGGVAIFLLVLGWWFSPIAPVKIGAPPAEEIARWLSEEVSLVALLLPDSQLTTLELPTPPPAAVAAARQIPADADIYSRAIKAIAESRFTEAEELLEKVPASDAEMAAKILAARGQVEIYAGRFPAALKWYQQAIDEHPEDLELLKQATAAHVLAGSFDKAAQLGQRLRERAVSDLTQLAISLNLLAAIETCRGNIAEAEQHCQQAQLIWEKNTTALPLALGGHIAASRNNQAVLYALEPIKYQGAESQFNGAFDQWREVYGSEHAHVAGSLNNMAVLYVQEARFNKAESKFQQALVIARKSLPSRHPNTAVILNSYADLLRIQGRLDEAQRMADDAMESLDRQLTSQVVANLNTSAGIAAQRGHYTEAAVRFRRVLELSKGRIPDDHPFIAETMRQLAEMNAERHHFAELEPLARTALEIFVQKLGPQHPATSRAHDTLGFVSLRLEHRKNAQQQFQAARQALEACQHQTGLKLPEEARNWAGQAALEPKRSWRDAVACYRKAIGVEAQVFGDPEVVQMEEGGVSTPATAGYLDRMARLYADNGMTPEDKQRAGQLYRKALAMAEQTLPDTHPVIAVILDDYADWQRAQGDEDEATALTKKAEQIRARQPNDDI